MSANRVTPYNGLLEKVMKFAQSVKYAHRRSMWSYPAGRLNEGWKLGALFERTRAADQLGYDVRVIAMDDGALRVEYVKRADIPLGWAP